MQDSLDIAIEICKLLKFSPQRDALFQKLKQELSPQAPRFHKLCPTRWTVHALSLESIRLNYETLHATWEEAVSIVRDSEVKARINGVAAMMKSFNFLFGLMLAERILKHTDKLSKTLQHSAMSAVEAHSISQLSIAVLQKMHTDLRFDQFWALVQLTQQSLHVSEPSMSRHRKQPRSYEDGVADPYYPEEPKLHYRQLYFPSIDAAIATIEDHFKHADYNMHAMLEQVILLAAKKDDYSSELQSVLEFYGEDFNRHELETQLQIFKEMEIACAGYSFTIRAIKSLSSPQQALISQLVRRQVCFTHASNKCCI